MKYLWILMINNFMQHKDLIEYFFFFTKNIIKFLKIDVRYIYKM